MPGPYRRSPVLALTLVLAAPCLAPAASKALVASVGDAAPGGGVFAGPAFSDWPTAAGAGWIAFRGEIIGGTTGETLVVARMTTPPTRIPVASLGEITPAGDGFRDCAGKFKGFVGHPAVNANGDVAFTALVQTVVSEETAAPGPTHAGIFAMR